MNTSSNTPATGAIRELTAEELNQVGGGGFNPDPIIIPIINHIVNTVIDKVVGWIGKHLM